MEKFCCQHCFTEKNIAQFIHEKGSFKPSCDYCETQNVTAIQPQDVFEFIEKFEFGLDEDSEGISLFELLDKKIYLFEDKVINKQSLYKDILINNQQLLNKKYSVPNSENIQKGWNEFSSEIKDKNRFFPQTELYKQIFTASKDSTEKKVNVFNLMVESLSRSFSNVRPFFRARINETQLTIDQMRAPKAISVSAGRANPIGIPYLYLADNIETCVAEVRPSNGCMVSVATFKLKETLNILDLTNPRKKASFLIQESESLMDALRYIDLLEIFANELSKPVQPHRSHLDYIPTQFLCEYFKTICGFHGISFNSSFGSGVNFVLFDQNLVDDDSMKYVSISKINHNFNEI